MAFVRNPVVYVPDLTNGRPIVDGKVYILTAGTVPPMHDSAIDPLDLVTVSYYNEANNLVEQPQPLYTSKGGCLYGNYPDAARQFIISPQAYVFAVYNRIGQLEYSAETTASDYVETNALAAANSTALVGGVEAGDVGYLTNHVVAIESFGADNTGIIDSSLAINNAATFAIANNATLVGFGTFKLSTQVSLRSCRVDFTNAVLVLDSTTQPLLVGGSSATTINPLQEFKRVYRSGGATSTPTMRVMGTKDQTFFVGACDYLQLYADTTAPNSNINGSIAYNTFNLGKIDRLELTNNPANVGVGAGDGGSIQWINENRFNLQRCARLDISGTYEHNHNVFVGGTFESTSQINITSGWDNYFYDVRAEGSPTVTFGPTTERNVIVNTWDSSTSNFADSGFTVTDNGFDNIVTDDFTLYRTSQTVCYTDVSDVVLDTQVSTTPTTRSRDLQRIFSSSTTAHIVESGYQPIVAGDYFRWVVVGPANTIDDTNARYRPRIYFYDASLKPVTATSDFILTTGGVLSVVSSNYIAAGTNVSGAVAVIKQAALDAGVRFVKVVWIGNSPSTASISQAVQMYVTQFSRKSDTYRGIPRLTNTPQGVGLLVSGIPTQGYAPAGYTAIKSDATAKYVNRFAAETTTTAAHSAGASVIAISSGASTANGDIVGINLDDLSTHWTTIAAGGGTNSITLTANLPSASASGKRVVFNRWSTY